MSNGDEYQIEIDSFPSFLYQFKEAAGNIAKDEAFSFSSENDLFANLQENKISSEQVKRVEYEKRRLEIDLEATNHRFAREKENFAQQLRSLQDSEASLKQELSRVKEEFYSYKKNNQESSQKTSFLDSQVDFLTKENRRLTEQHRIDKESWEATLETLKRTCKGEEKEDKSFLLSRAEAKISELTSELIDLRSRNESQKVNYQKKLDFVDGEVRKLKQEEEKYIKELEIKNKNNEDIILQLNKRIKDIERLVEGEKPERKVVVSKYAREKSLEKPVTLSEGEKHERKVQVPRIAREKSLEKPASLSEPLSKSSKSPLVQSPKMKSRCIPPRKRSTSSLKDSTSSKDLSRKKTPLRDVSSEKSSNLPSARIQNKAPSYLRKENQSSNIEGIEKEIAVLTGRYKYLLQMSEDASDLMSLKSEINKVAKDIEEKSNQLFAIKKKQQDFLKQQIKIN